MVTQRLNAIRDNTFADTFLRVTPPAVGVNSKTENDTTFKLGGKVRPTGARQD